MAEYLGHRTPSVQPPARNGKVECPQCGHRWEHSSLPSWVQWLSVVGMALLTLAALVPAILFYWRRLP